MWSNFSLATKLSFVYLMLVCPSKTCARISSKNKTRDLLSCVRTDAALRKAVKAAPNGKSTNINICDKISISSKLDLVSKITGIDITNKVINLSCNLPSNKRCTLDGGYRSRIFFGKNAKLSVVKVNFVKASSSNDCSTCVEKGGALQLTGKSTLNLDRSSFMNNAATDFGGAIYIEESSLVIKGGNTRSDASIFSNNSALNEGAISASLCTVTAENGITIFRDNSAIGAGGAVYFFDCKVTLKNVNFFQNKAEYVSAAVIAQSDIKLENVVFVNNTQDYNGALSVWNSKADLKTVSFVNNTGRIDRSASMLVDKSKVNLTNCVFNRNVIPNTESGANIYIDIDDNDDKTSYVSCLSNNNIFCNGLGSKSIFSSDGGSKTTNCQTKGIAGKPGQGKCI